MSPVFDPDNPQGTHMQFVPKTEQELQDALLLDPGTYDFEILKAEETTSKTSGKPMIKVTLKVFAHNGSSRQVTDYLLESMAWKLRHFFCAIGKAKDYDNGELNPESCVGCTGKLALKVEPGKDGFNSKNAVKDYIDPDKGAAEKAEAAHAPTRVVSKAPAIDPNEPPF